MMQVFLNSTPALSVTVLVSAEEPMKDVIEHAKWHLLSIGTRFVSGTNSRLAALLFLEVLQTSVLSLKLRHLSAL